MGVIINWNGGKNFLKTISLPRVYKLFFSIIKSVVFNLNFCIVRIIPVLFDLKKTSCSNK